MMKYLSSRIIPLHLNYKAHIIQIYSREFLSHYSTKNIFLKEYKCFICGKEEGLHLHHIIPVCECGKHNYKNLCLLCSEHHKKVENGILTIPLKGYINHRLIKKINKIHRKYYKEYDQELIGTYPQEFIFNHLAKDKAIKDIIKIKPERLPEIKARLICKSS